MIQRDSVIDVQNDVKPSFQRTRSSNATTVHAEWRKTRIVNWTQRNRVYNASQMM